MTDTFPKWYPPAVRRLIPAGDNDPVMRPVLVSLHVAASLGPSLFNWFDGPSGGIESHLYLTKGGKWEQYRQFDREADAQLGGNSWVTMGGSRLGSVTIETEGTALGYWTRAQKAEIKAFLLWAHEHLGIPLNVVPVPNPPGPLSGGVGYHSLFKRWNSLSKSCPGPKRIAWFKAKLVPWMAEQGRQYVTFKDGDTIASVAAAHELTVAQFCRLNRISVPVGSSVRVK